MCSFRSQWGRVFQSKHFLVHTSEIAHGWSKGQKGRTEKEAFTEQCKVWIWIRSVWITHTFQYNCMQLYFDSIILKRKSLVTRYSNSESWSMTFLSFHYGSVADLLKMMKKQISNCCKRFQVRLWCYVRSDELASTSLHMRELAWGRSQFSTRGAFTWDSRLRESDNFDFFPKKMVNYTIVSKSEIHIADNYTHWWY